MESERDYQKRELNSFLNQKHAFFDTVADFEESLQNTDLDEQLQWIENGTYGAGACFALQHTLNHLSPRYNKVARIGQVYLHTLYGKPFSGWSKLSPKTQKMITRAVEKWLKRKRRNFARTLEL